MFDGIISSIFKEAPLVVVAFLSLIMWGNRKAGQCKIAMTKEMKDHVADSLKVSRDTSVAEISHLKEMIEQKMHDQKKLLKTEIHQNKEILSNLKKTKDS